MPPGSEIPTRNPTQGYAELGPRLFDNGYEPLPLTGKAPAVRGWRSLITEKRIETFAAKFPNANIGIKTGSLVVIDIDIDEPGLAHDIGALASDLLGFSDFIRIGRSPRRGLFYRTDNPMPKQIAGKVEILGVGQQVACFGIHPDTAKPYEWPLECILDNALAALPVVDPEGIRAFLSDAARAQRLPEISYSAIPDDDLDVALPTEIVGRPVKGKRNDWLFRQLLDLAGSASSLSTLTHSAFDLNGSMPHPLNDEEVEKVAASVWRYKMEGRLMPRGRQSIVLPVGRHEIASLARTPGALDLLALLKATRTTPRFTIPQQATARHLGWGTGKIGRAIDALIDHGLIEIVGLSTTSAGRWPAIRYRWRKQ